MARRTIIFTADLDDAESAPAVGTIGDWVRDGFHIGGVMVAVVSSPEAKAAIDAMIAADPDFAALKGGT